MGSAHSTPAFAANGTQVGDGPGCWCIAKQTGTVARTTPQVERGPVLELSAGVDFFGPSLHRFSHAVGGDELRQRPATFGVPRTKQGTCRGKWPNGKKPVLSEGLRTVSVDQIGASQRITGAKYPGQSWPLSPPPDMILMNGDVPLGWMMTPHKKEFIPVPGPWPSGVGLGKDFTRRGPFIV